MKILVTGAGGFLGQHLVKRLVARGDDVTALVWPAGTDIALRDMPARIIEGNICNREAIERAVQEQDIVFHCAGKVDDWGPRDEYYRVNVEGTRNMLEASLAAGVGHFIYVSSLVVLGVPETNPVDETQPYTDNLFNPYLETKLLSEQMVREFYAAHRLPVTIIRPGILWGPGDSTIFPRMARLAKCGLMIPVGRGDNTLCLTYIANMVEALVLAARAEHPDGQIYHITDGETITSKQYFRELVRAVGAWQPPGSIPFWMADGFAVFAESMARLMQAVGLKVPPLFTRYGLYLWASTMVAPSAKARERLGYEQKVFFQEGMKNLAAWYADNRR